MIARVALLAVLAACLAAATTVPAASAASSAKRCATPTGFMAGPFLAEGVRARAVGCANARKLVGQWGRTKDCVMPAGGASDRTCRVGRYRCVTRSKGEELSRATCKRRGTRRAVGFDFGS